MPVLDVEQVKPRSAVRGVRTLWGAVALLLWCSLPGFAAVVVSKDFAALCAEADMIFVGTVTDVHAQWVDPEHRWIETLVTFSNLEPLWGVDADSVSLRFSGGQIGDIAEAVQGMPSFSAGERVVIFARNGRLVSPIVGFNQGHFRVIAGPDGPVVMDAQGRASGTAAAAVQADGSSSGGIPVTTFTDKIRAELGKRPGGSR
jgi:hypothetical protein